MGQIRDPSPCKAGGEAGHHRSLAGQRKEQDHGLRGRGEAGHKVHRRVEHGNGHRDPAQDHSGGGGAERGDVRGEGIECHKIVISGCIGYAI